MSNLIWSYYVHMSRSKVKGSNTFPRNRLTVCQHSVVGYANGGAPHARGTARRKWKMQCFIKMDIYAVYGLTSS
jgi:hypothetical protein